MSDHHCLACARDIAEFVDGPNGRRNARCPKCGALERHRFVAMLFDSWNAVLREAQTVLDIAPQSETRRLIRKRTSGCYVGVDIDLSVRPDLLGSITELPFATGSIDVAICMHVLEHIPNDGLAIAELARVLTTTGVGFVQVPRRSGGPTDEDPAAPGDERIARFGQADHVRYYGDDFEARLYAGGLQPAAAWPAMFLSESEIARFGLKADEHMWIVRTRRPDGDLFPGPSEVRNALATSERELRNLRRHPVVAALRAVKRGLRRSG
jgi:SAM-dependent methyltransferase